MNRLCALLVLTFVTGCATINRIPMDARVRVEDGREPIETVEISNTCWHFLSFLPVASGNPDNPNGFGCCCFRNTLTLGNQFRMLQKEAERVGAGKVLDVTTLTTDETCFFILFLREKIHTSAVLAK